MGIKVKAIERNVAFEKGKQKWAFVMQADLYSQLNASKVIEEAAIRLCTVLEERLHCHSSRTANDKLTTKKRREKTTGVHTCPISF